jgi:hypothetical protein
MALQPVARTIQIKTSTGNKPLTEPHPGASIEEIRTFHQAKHPELATCGVDQEGNTITFKPNLGTRG